MWRCLFTIFIVLKTNNCANTSINLDDIRDAIENQVLSRRQVLYLEIPNIRQTVSFEKSKSFKIVFSQNETKSSQAPQHPLLTMVDFDQQSLVDILKVLRDSKLGLQAPVFVASGAFQILDEKDNKKDSCSQIQEEIYFIDMGKLEMFECYSVNNVRIKTTIGTFMWNYRRNKFDLHLEPLPLSFEIRRSNFQGKHFIAMTDHFPPFAILKPGFEMAAPFFENNQTYLVSNWTGPGLYYDLLKIMATDMNFTYSLYKRKDGLWGTVIDGKPRGMLSNLYDGSADIIAAGFALSFVRSNFCQYLNPINSAKAGIFIKSESFEDISYFLYIRPLTGNIWMVVILIAILIATWILLSTSPTTHIDCLVTY